MRTYSIRIIPILLAIPMLAPASWGQGKGRDKHETASNYRSPSVVIVFSTQERDTISDWFWTNRNGLPPGLAKRESLPPGLQKQLKRNGTLPPGLQKKLTPLPYELDSRLVRLPSDYLRVVIGRDIVLLDRRNNIIVDLISDVIREPNDDRPNTARERDRGEVYGSNAPAPVRTSSPAPKNVVASTSSATPSRAAGAEPFSLNVRLTKTLSTETTKTGDRFVATLEEPVYEDGKVVARKGATVEGQVVDSAEGGRVKGVASISLKLSRIQLLSGKYLAVTSDPFLVEANATKGEDATKIALTTGIGAGVGALVGGGKGAAVGAATGAAAGTGVVLATRGEPAVIPSESVLEFTVRAN